VRILSLIGLLSLLPTISASANQFPETPGVCSFHSYREHALNKVEFTCGSARVKLFKSSNKTLLEGLTEALDVAIKEGYESPNCTYNRISEGLVCIVIKKSVPVVPYISEKEPLSDSGSSLHGGQ
jgi:hypothetical protein